MQNFGKKSHKIHSKSFQYMNALVAVEHRFGCRACESNVCVCGKTVDTRGLHGFACRRSARTQQRHRQMNDMLWSAIKRAQTSFPSSLKCEVVFTVSNSGGRPPSLTGKLISQHSGISGFISLRVGQSPPANVRRANAILSSTLPQLLLLQLRTGRYMAPSCPRRPSGSPDDDDKAETF